MPPETKSKKIEEKTNANMTDLQIILNALYKIANYRGENTDDLKREEEYLLTNHNEDRSK